MTGVQTCALPISGELVQIKRTLEVVGAEEHRAKKLARDLRDALRSVMAALAISDVSWTRYPALMNALDRARELLREDK